MNQNNNNIIDALVYSEIKNNLTPSNFSLYDNLKNSIRTNDSFDSILSKTTIKKGCCSGLQSQTDPNSYSIGVSKLSTSP